MIAVRLNGKKVAVESGTSVAAAVLTVQSAFRRSVTGELRAPLCGMGICMECRVQLNGRPQERSCQVLCEEGMEIVTDV